jgi:hypothetical protein
VGTYLHETTSHITSFSSFDSSINQTFTTRDSVEKEFGGTETSKETVSDETFGRRTLGYQGYARKSISPPYPLVHLMTYSALKSEVRTDLGNR